MVSKSIGPGLCLALRGALGGPGKLCRIVPGGIEGSSEEFGQPEPFAGGEMRLHLQPGVHAQPVDLAQDLRQGTAALDRIRNPRRVGQLLEIVGAPLGLDEAMRPDHAHAGGRQALRVVWLERHIGRVVPIDAEIVHIEGSRPLEQ